MNDPQTLNLFGYVRNNPLNRTDPDGHYDIDVGGGKKEHHFGWCIWHTLGFYHTRPELIRIARWYEAEFYKERKTPPGKQPKLSDDEVLNAYRNGKFAIHTQYDQFLDALGIGGVGFAVYRGGNGFRVRPKVDVVLDPKTGLVQPGAGVSLNSDPAAVEQFGGAYRVESVPDELEIIQKGGANHFEIAPREPMTLSRYQELLNQVKLVPAK